MIEKKKPPKLTTFKIYNVEQSREEIQKLIDEKQNFTVVETANTCKIYYSSNNRNYCNWYLENSKSKYFLILLNELKREILKNSKRVEACTYSPEPSNVKYYAFSNSIRSSFSDLDIDAGSVYNFSDVYEADISHAYYRAAYVLGFISKSLYSKILKTMTKPERLRLLGCIASVKHTRMYELGEHVGETLTQKEPVLRDAWFKICNYIDTALIELQGILGKDFLFYWVDGIYFRHTEIVDDFKNSNHYHEIRRIFYKFDVEFKLVHLPYFELLNMGTYLEIKIIKPDGKIKRFFPERKQVIKYSLIELNPKLKK